MRSLAAQPPPLANWVKRNRSVGFCASVMRPKGRPFGLPSVRLGLVVVSALARDQQHRWHKTSDDEADELDGAERRARDRDRVGREAGHSEGGGRNQKDDSQDNQGAKPIAG